MARLTNLIAGLLLAIVLCARRAASQASLPSVETALWSNAFVALVGNMSVGNPSMVTAVLEKAVRDQYTQQGYGVSIFNVRGCVGTQVISLPGYMPSPASAPGPGPAFVVPEPAMPPSSQQVVYGNPNGTYTGAPLQMPLQMEANGYDDQPNPLAPGTVCYRLNATIFFEPKNSTYLDPALGTSNELNSAITQQARAAGVWAQFYLLNVTLASTAGQVVYTGDQLQHLPETGYLTTLAVSGEGVVPAAFPHQVVFLAAFKTLNIYNSTNTVRNRFQNVTQNSAGFNITCLSVVRPDAAEGIPQAMSRIIQDGSLLQTVREAGLPATSLSIVAIQEDNSTTLGSQLSAQLTNRPVVTSIGTNIPSAPPQAQSPPATPLGKHAMSPGVIAGIIVGGAAAAALLALAGLYIARSRLASQKTHSNAGSSKSRDSPPPVPNTSPQLSAQSPGYPNWPGSCPPARYARSLSTSHGSGDFFPSSSGAQGAGLSVHSTGGSWQLEAGSLEICRRPDGSDWVLGSGSYGIVYKGLRDGVQEVAIKKLSHIDKWQLQQFRKEIDLLRALSYDRNIVQFFGASMDPDNPFLVLEHMGGGDLREVLNDPKKASKLLWHRKGHKIALDIARGLVFLHKRRIIHADLKSKNILLSADLGVAKLADVGLSRIMQGSQASSSPMMGTFSHAAPEMILGYKVNEKVDIFSFGVILWEIIMWEPPIRGQLHTIDTPRQCPPEIAALITHCMHRSPKKRPSAKEVYKIIQASASAAGDSSSDADEPTALNPFHLSSAPRR